MESSSRIELPLPTSRTVNGPKLHLSQQQLTLEYDYVLDDGTVAWTRTQFNAVIAFEYRQVACCVADDLDAYNKIVRHFDSSWLKEMLVHL